MDSANPLTLILAVLPKLPVVLKTVVGHSLRLSENSSKWDLRTELIIRVIRAYLDSSNKPRKMSDTQAASLKDPGVKGHKWISRYTIPKPTENDIRQRLFQAIEDLKNGGEVYQKPDLLPVEVEWTGYRQDAKYKDPEPKISEIEKYKNLMKEVTSDVVILYLHGGAYYLMDPVTHRGFVAKLCHLTGGRAMSVRYRLAPQNPFPAALLDAFLSYLSLLYPPEGAPHEAIPASNIVISGDSAGGNLSLVLLQLLLELHRSAGENTIPQVMFNGKMVDVPLPAGVALNSPWCDMTSCLDSIKRNAKYDYLPNAWNRERIPECPIWPPDPPRLHIYADDSVLLHPLCSPLAAKDWSKAPPMFFVCGEELLSDEGSSLACKIARQEVPVVWEQYEAMPHCFGLIFANTPVGDLCFDGWAAFCEDAVAGKVKTNGQFFTARRLNRKDADVTKLMDELNLDEEKIAERMKASVEKATREFREQEERRLKQREEKQLKSKKNRSFGAFSFRKKKD
jgi:acetyl esterase/lipase